MGMSLWCLGKVNMIEFMWVFFMFVVDWLDEFFESKFIKVVLCLLGIQSTFVGLHLLGIVVNLLFYEGVLVAEISGGLVGLIDVLMVVCFRLGVSI